MIFEAPLWIGALLGATAGAVVVGAVARARLRVAAQRAEESALERDRERRRLERSRAGNREAAADAATSLARLSERARRTQVELGVGPERLAAGPQADASATAAEADEVADALATARRSLAVALEALGRARESTLQRIGDDAGEREALAARAAELSGAAERAVAVAQAFADALTKIQASAAETAELSTQVSADAERGYTAVHRTLDEIERIRELTGVVRGRIDALGERVAGIGHVIRVIQEVTEKTNLLALNASIIAAQAGQHGRSFAVVAREIKALAQQTETSTREISEQVAGVQAESSRVTEAMVDGVTAVNEGFQVAIAAGDALESIRRSARTAQKRVQSMNRTVKRQAVSERVLEAAQAVSERAADLARRVSADAAGASELGDTARRLGEAVEIATAALAEDREVGERAGHALARSAEVCRTLDRERRGLAEALARVRDRAEADRATIDRLDALWREVERVGDELRERFLESRPPGVQR